MTVAGRYRLGEQIARGGMAVVHYGTDTVLRRPVAIKVVASEKCGNYIYRDAVRRDALSAARLTHPNVVRVFDYGEMEKDGRHLPFVVMELVEGRSLAAHLRENGPLPWREAARICGDIARALAAAHDRHVVHRDVKPDNIMLATTGPKMVDFGVSAPPGEPSIDDDGRVWGTPSYFAPEQLHGEPAGTAADVYALGLVLHTCLTGRAAWTGRTFRDVVIARALSPLPQLAADSGVPGPIAAVHRRCLMPQPRKRPVARQVARLLKEACARTP